MSLSRKAVLIVTVPVLFELVFLIMFFEAERRSTEHRDWQARSTETAMSAGRLLGLVNDALSAARGFAITRNPGLRDAYLRAVAKLPNELRELERLSATTAAAAGRGRVPRTYTVSDVGRVTAGVLAHLQRESVLVRTARPEEVIEHLKGDAAAGLMEEFRRVARAYQLEELTQQRYEHEALERLAYERHAEAVAFVATNALLALALIWFLLRHVRRRLRLVLQDMSRYAAGETLHARRQATDEIGSLDAQFHEMAQQLDVARRELQDRNETLARMNAEKSHFMGMAAHDLRSPLFGVLLSTGVVLRRAGLAEADQALLRQVQSSVKGMSNLVSDFLDVTLIDAGELRLRPAEADIAAIARECLELAQSVAEQKQIEVRCEGEPSAPATVDREKIAQVITNLLTNAVKFSPAGSRVEMSVARDESSVRVSVRDQGRGIAPHEMALLFVPFSRTSTRPTAGETSTGLGLAICRKIVEGHGGRIWAESELGTGSVFSFEVPRAPAGAAAPESAAS
jgi:signal transduction histidine kinase